MNKTKKDLRLYNIDTMSELEKNILSLGLEYHGSPIAQQDARAIVSAMADFEEFCERFLNEYLPRLLNNATDKDITEDILYDFSSSFSHSAIHVNKSDYLSNVINNFKISEELAEKQ